MKKTGGSIDKGAGSVGREMKLGQIFARNSIS
jgi:hypothetical protein